MSDEAQLIQARSKELSGLLRNDAQHNLRNARINYYTAQVLTFVSSCFGIAAAVLGLVPWSAVEKWEVGLAAAIGTALVGFNRQLGFQQKANWQYRKSAGIDSLLRRLVYELPVNPSADDIAAISKAWSIMEKDMSKEWEDMQHESAALTKGPTNRRLNQQPRE